MASDLRLDIEPKRIPVAPGEPFEVSLHVFNATTIIDGFSATFLGLDAEWVKATPSPLSLFPAAEGDIKAVITLPRGYPAGAHDIGVKIQSLEHPEVTAVGMVTLDVASSDQALMSVEPQSVTGGKSAYFGVSVANTGNTQLELVMAGTDAEQATTVFWNPDALTVAPGERQDTVATVVGPRPWFGSPVLRVLEFQAIGKGEPLQGVATFMQKSRIPRGLLVLLAVLLVLGIWLGSVLFGIDKITADDAALAEGGIFTAFDEVAASAAETAMAAEADAEANPAVGTLSGTVTANNQSPPQVAGATATAFDEQGVEVASADTGDDGTYTMEVPVGVYFVRFTASGFQEQWFFNSPSSTGASTREVTEGAGAGDVDAELIGEFATLGGTVTTGDDSSGVLVTLELVGPATAAVEPAPATGALFSGSINGAVLPLAPPGPTAIAAALPLFQLAPVALPHNTTTNADGEFSIERVPTPATYRLSFVKPGFGTAAEVFTLAAGQSKLDFELELTDSPSSIEGTVFDSFGAPLGDVTVTVAGGDTLLTIKTPTTATAEIALGSFVVEDLTPGPFTLTFTKDGYVTQVQSVTLVPDQVTFVTVLMQGGAGSISGRTSDAGGPLGGVTVTATDEDGNEFSTVSSTEGAQEGAYSIQGLNTPGIFSVKFAKTGYVTSYESVTLASAQKATGVDALLKRGDSVTGEVRDRLGPLQGVTVKLEDEDGNFRIVETGPNGRYEVVALFELPGPYKISFTKTGYVPIALQSVPLAPEGSTTYPTQTMQASPGSIVGSVYVPDAVAPPAILAHGGVTVTLLENGAPTGKMTTTNGAGSFSLTGVVTPATYTVRFTKSGFQTVEETIVAGPAQNIAMAAVTQGINGGLTGNARNRLGEGLAGATVTITGFSSDLLSFDPASVAPAVVLANGSFSFTGVPSPGKYTLSIAKAGYITETTTGELLANLTTRPIVGDGECGGAADSVCLAGKPSSIAVTLRSNVFGDVLDGLDVALSFPGGIPAIPGATMTTNLSGAVTFTGLPTPANVVISVYEPDYQSYTSASFRLNPDGTVIREVLLGYAGSSISGTVSCDAGGGNVAGVEVALEKDSEGFTEVARRNVSRFGRYFFTNLGPGTYQVRLLTTAPVVLQGPFMPFYPNSLIGKDFPGADCP